MNLGLAPKITSPINKETFLVWFNTSNKYLFLSNGLKELLDLYFLSKNQNIFITKAYKTLGLKEQVSLTYFKAITTLLEECNQKSTSKKIYKKPYSKVTNTLNKKYLVSNHYINIRYASKGIMNFLHNQIDHLSTKNLDKNIKITIDIQEDETNFYLYVNEEFIDSYLKTNYHLLQGKFNLILLNCIYQSKEKDWLAMLHGSSVSNEKEAFIFVGHSGNGKSTFTSLMVANGYHLVADDITPIHASNTKVCSTPYGISIKEGAFHVLNRYTDRFKSSKEFTYSTKKGMTKYITTLTPFEKRMLPCNSIILVKYKKNSPTKLSKIAPKTILEVLIPESWTSPLDKNAENFMNWIKNLNYYELTYSNNNQAIKKISTLFK